MKRVEICETAARLIGGERNRQHGDPRPNHENIGALWNAYLERRFPQLAGARLSAHDVALMMSLLKIARTMAGNHNPDDYVDGVGYLAIAGGFAAEDAALAARIAGAEA